MKNNMMRRNKTGIVVLFLLLGFAAYLLWPAPEPLTWKDVLPKPEHTKVDETKSLRGQTRAIEMAGRTFNIPLMYIDTKLKSGIHQDSIILEVIWPEMKSIYELDNKQEYEKVWKQEHRRGWILLEPSNIRPSFDVQISNLKNNLTKDELVGTSEGLEKHKWYHGKPDNPELWSEMYLEKDAAGHITGYIECRNGPSIVVPGCSQKFINAGLIYQISYNQKVFLSEWRDQKKRSIDFMNRMELKSSNQR